MFSCRCCKSRSTGSTNKDVESRPLDKDEENQDGASQENTKVVTINEKVPDNTSNDKTSPETNNEQNHNDPSKSFETSKQNGNVPTNEEDAKGDRVVSVIYATPDKSVKHEPNANGDENKSTECEDGNKDSISSDYSSLKKDKSPEQTSLSETPNTSPEVLYAKPDKQSKNKRSDAVTSAAKTQDLELQNRQSFGDNYATIKDTLESKDGPPREACADETATYEDIKLDDVLPRVRDVPPRLPSDTLTRPPRLPSNSNDDVEPPYAEASQLGSSAMVAESSDDVFVQSSGKSKSLHEKTPPYAQTQIVPRSQSARERHHSDNKQDEEPKVVLGTPGIKKPSIKMPGTTLTELDIPNLDYDDNPDYERVEIPKTSEILKSSEPPSTTTGSTDNGKSGWVENSIYSSANDPTRNSAIDTEESPELVTYEQTMGSSVNKEQSPKQNVTVDETNNLESDHEESPELVTYEQTNILKPNGDDLIENEYEEIRRSRLTEFPKETTTQTIDGKPVTEL